MYSASAVRAASRNGVAPTMFRAVTPAGGRFVTRALTSAPYRTSVLTNSRLSIEPEPGGAGLLLPATPALRTHETWCKRGPTPRRGVRIGAALEEHRRQLIVGVAGGDEERVDADLRGGRSGAGGRVGGHALKGVVRIRARVEQRHRGVDLSLPRREEERREADLRPVVDVGATPNEHPHDVHVALGGGPHQRRLSAPALLGVDVGAAVEQERHACPRCPSARPS